MPDRPSALAALVLKLNSIGHLHEEDRQALEAAPIFLNHLSADQDLLHEGERPTQCCILLKGWVCRHKSLQHGGKQILSLQVAGDLIDLQSLDMPVMDHTVTALDNATVACISHAAMRNLLAQSPNLRSILWRATLIEAATTRQWLFNLGQRDAVKRLAHLVCEMFVRLQSVGLAHDIAGTMSFAWPMTQLRVAQATGMSAVHVNRSLQELRARNLIVGRSTQVTIRDWPQLATLAEFDPSYLGLEAGTKVAA